MTAKKNKNLVLENASENNLKNLTLEIPHDVLAVVTGISGSGKSSLAFDTVFAEGQRRYIETFSPYTRQFFNKVKKSDLDYAENVRPAVAIQQKTRITNSRSTVGSVTDINDYLKILWSNLAVAFCPDCDVELKSYDPSSLAIHAQKLCQLKEDSTFLICAERKIKGGKKGIIGEADSLKALGFSRFFNPESGAVERLEEELPKLTPDNTVIVVLDRFTCSSFSLKRVKDSLEQAFSLSEEACLLLESKGYKRGTRKSYLTIANNSSQANIKHPDYTSYKFFKSYRCPHSDVRVERPRPSLFSYNHPIGACPHCRGFGNVLTLDSRLCVPDERLSLAKNAIQCWSGQAAKAEQRKMLAYAKKSGIDVTLPWKDLSKKDKEIIFENDTREFKGVRAWFKKLERKAYKMHVRVFLSRYRSQVPCPVCHGSRLKASALAYRLRGKTLPDIWKMSAEELLVWLEATQKDLQREKSLPRQLKEVLRSIVSRVQCLLELGLPYLSLDRQARTLSGGETQRVNLVTALGSELISTHFVLDEPSVGLHARDTEKLSSSIRELVTNGNSVLLVEHDPDLLYSGDYVLELGPDAGEKGGSIVYSGDSEGWEGLPPSQLKRGKVTKTSVHSSPHLEIMNATARNLKNVNARIPLNQLVCLTGVSGSGKSTLTSEVIQQAYDRYTKEEVDSPENIVKGFEQIDKLFLVDQSSLAKSPRANIATYTKIWDPIRDLLARTDDAIVRAISKSAFSFNVEGGRCPECKGAGFIKEDMQFLSDVYIPCELCGGKRFQPAVLEVTYKGKNVFELLQMSVRECGEFFHNNSKISSASATLQQLGLGHLTLGHPLSSLSGGEAQRLKLVPYVEKGSSGHSLFLFDEPTTGLHPRDIDKLISLFWFLKDCGHSILCVEHNLTVIANSDYILDLGPEGGSKGGQILVTGSPAELIKKADKSQSHTTRYLHEYIKNGHKRKKKQIVKKTKAKNLKQKNSEFLEISGAREHNLQDIDVKIPLGQVVAITGVSGSGKSSIAKDIVYAEGQRRYLDCLSPYARQFIKELKRPDIDQIKNVQPTICVHQHTFQPSKLSTVATMSEVYNYLRLLYAKAGEQYCPDHPEHAITPQSAREIASAIKNTKEKDLRILAPVIKLKKGLHKAVFDRAMDSEIMEVRVDGVFARPSQFEHGLEKNKPHTIEYVIARINPMRVDLSLLQDAIQQALSLGGGTLIVNSGSGEEVYSTSRTCPVCKKGFYKPDPEDLSFNSKRGTCLACKGTGRKSDNTTCLECGGSRINSIGRSLKINKLNIHQACLFNAQELLHFLNNLQISSRESLIAEPVLKELTEKLKLLIKFGLSYIELNRDCSGLSSGELQRLRLAAAMGSPLSGVMYVFDEPSAGLHPLDNQKVLGEFADLADKGNSVLLIEHDTESIMSAETIIEVGPGGGRSGGLITFSGSRKEFKLYSKNLKELTDIPKEGTVGGTRSGNGISEIPALSIRNASKNNLSGFDLMFPLEKLVCVAGVSGAGKSSLVHGVISDCINLGEKKDKVWKLDPTSVESSIEISRILNVDQKPIGATARSTPASYLGIFDEIRKLFAKTTEARSRGWSAGHFSYNTGKGRCEECKGQGQRKLEMSFLADARVECEACLGRRYKDDTELIKYLGLSISDVLFLTFTEAKAIFANHKKIHQALHTACELGLGYLTIGQSSATLSGGESQRVKLVSELNTLRKGHTLYILDEPTTGLHRQDVFRLLKVLKDLVAANNTVVVIEHDPDLIKNADYLVELGPGPGASGGEVIFQGFPTDLKKANTPWSAVLYGNGPKKKKNLALPGH